MLSISSRNRVPPLANSNLPMRRLLAPVKAPASWPNSSLSTTDSASAPALIATNGPSRRADRSCRARATTSLPLPVSPRISTSALVRASAATCWRRRAMPGDRPIRRPSRASRPDRVWRSWRFSSTRRRMARARRTPSSRVSLGKGFSRKSQAPARIACTASGTSPWPVIRITGSSPSRSCTWPSSCRPSRPGMRMSLTTTPGQSAGRASATPRASPSACTRRPARSRVWLSAWRRCGSSSISSTSVSAATVVMGNPPGTGCRCRCRPAAG
ncbi:hypothetical protein D3C80_1051330 [compost metagenome]